jgi:predicted CDP-diglyceride synthetase/phosphatidate cytidylyltransferase
MTGLIDKIPRIDLALIMMVAIAALVALPAARRGGRYRGLPGWVGSWVVFAAVLISLSQWPRWISFPTLGVLMFAALRGYFYVAPVRSGDRYAVLATYLSIPLALWAAFVGAQDTFLAATPVALFLIIPVFVAAGPVQGGMMDSMGRFLLGVLFFVYCTAHLALLVDLVPVGLDRADVRDLPQLFGILVLAAELPQRMTGRIRHGGGWMRPTIGIVGSVVLATGLGYALAGWTGLVDDDGARAGLFVAVAVTLGSMVSNAVAEDLDLASTSARMGRGSMLDRTAPAVYAAPVFFHYLNTFS